MSLHNMRRGNAAIFALTLIPLLGFGALSVDIGLQRMTITQIQAAAEAASTGGAAYLNGTEEGLTSAVTRAKTIGNLNYVYGGTFEIVDADVQLYIYDESTGDKTPATVNDDPGEVNAIEVSPSTTIDSALSRFAFNLTSLDATGSAMAVATRGGVAKYVDCYLPFALPSCVFDGWRNLGGTGNPDPRYLETDSDDTVAWGLPAHGDAVNPPTVKAQLLDNCSGVTASTADTDDTNNADAAEEMAVQNGVAANIYPYMGDLINGDLASDNVTYWPSGMDDLPIPDKNDFTFNPWPQALMPAVTLVSRNTRWGWSINGVVPIIEHDCVVDATTGEVLSSDPLNQSEPIIGWTYAYIYDVGTDGNDKPMMMQFDFVNDYDIGYGQCEGSGCEGNVTGTFPPTQVW